MYTKYIPSSGPPGTAFYRLPRQPRLSVLSVIRPTLLIFPLSFTFTFTSLYTPTILFFSYNQRDVHCFCPKPYFYPVKATPSFKLSPHPLSKSSLVMTVDCCGMQWNLLESIHWLAYRLSQWPPDERYLPSLRVSNTCVRRNAGYPLARLHPDKNQTR